MHIFSRIPADVWLAALVATAVAFFALDNTTTLLVAAYGLVCAYIIAKVFMDA